MRGPYHDELQTILLTGRHPDGRALGRALAHRLADTFGVPRPVYHEAGALPQLLPPAARS